MNPAQLIYLSSMVVYGDQTSVPREESESISPSQPYGMHKKQLENECLSYAKATVLRLSNVYGPQLVKGTVISDINDQLIQSGDIRIKNHDSIRDFLHIEDLCKAVEILIDQPQSGLFNLGSGEGTSVYQIAKKMLAISGNQKRNIVSSHSTSNSSVLILDISKIRKKTGWNPRWSLEDGLTTIIEKHIAK